jgi:hypothetical protein
MVVALKDSDSYRAFIGQNRPETVGGHYDVEANQLVVFDFGSRQPDLTADPRRVNLFTLVHETTHLLSYNTGLLPRRGDVPAAISEGLATYVELWRPRARSAIGATNRARLEALRQGRGAESGWIPIRDLLAADTLFDEANTMQLAYAESWLLVHLLVKSPQWLPKFQAYLSGIPREGGDKGRVAYAERQLGSLRLLDREVRRHGQRELEH